MVESKKLNDEEFEGEVRKAVLGATSVQDVENRIRAHFSPAPEVWARGEIGNFRVFIIPYPGGGTRFIKNLL